MNDISESKNKIPEKINRVAYFLLCGLIIAMGLYFIVQSFAIFQ